MKDFLRVWLLASPSLLLNGSALACTNAELEVKREEMWAYARQQSLESLHHGERWRKWAFAVNNAVQAEADPLRKCAILDEAMQGKR